MKLYYAPGACSLADHIALIETGIAFQAERVDIKTHTTASGRDFRTINPKSYVPALVLNSGETVTENVAVLDWISETYPALGVPGPLGRTRQLEALSFIATELHPNFKPMWHGGSEGEKAKARTALEERFRQIAATLKGGYLFGDTLSVADCYLFVMLRWAEKFAVAIPGDLGRLKRLMEHRPAVLAALEAEELHAPPGRSSARVRENTEQRRFERPINDSIMAAAYYKLADGNVELIHTETPVEFSGLGIGTELARGTFDLLRESGRKAILKCPFMVHFYNTHPEYVDIVAV
jgi:glutathione S-transferase